MTSRAAITIGAAALCVAGCGKAPNVGHDLPVTEASSRVPRDPRLADLYTHSCRACHAVAESGAPLSGDSEAWRARWKKGLPTLVANTVQGADRMPAGGQCARCSVEDFEALIRFMAMQDGP